MNWLSELLNFVREHASWLLLMVGGYILISLLIHGVKLLGKRFTKTFVDLKTGEMKTQTNWKAVGAAVAVFLAVLAMALRWI